jgi:phosphatidylglycerophosphate synthase
LLEANGDLEGLVSRAAQRHVCSDLRPAAGVALRVTRPDQAVFAERRLVAAAGNVRDGRLDRLLNRRLSRPLTLLLARTRLEPNHVSVLGILLGLAGAALVACRGYAAPLAGLLLIQAASVLDCCDGELARLRLCESTLGHWLDIAGDTVTHAALFAAIGIVAWREGLASAPTLALLLVAGVILTFACVTYAEETTELRARVGGPVNGLIDGLVSALTTRDYLAVVLAFAVADGLAWFLAGAAIGVNVFWPTLLVLLIVERRQRTATGRPR